MIGTYGGGGGGGSSGTGGSGAGGLGGGGAGTTSTGGSGVANTGGGGGGGSTTGGGAGGSGLVVVQYAYLYSGLVTLGGPIDLQSASTLDAYGSSGVLSVTGLISTSTGTGGLTIASSNSAGGIVRFSNANTYLGNTTINSGATLQMNNTNAIPNGSGKGNVLLSGTLDLNNFSTVVNGLTSTGGTVLVVGNTSAAPLVVTNALTLTGNLTLDVTGTATTAGLYRLVSYGSQTGAGTVAAINVNAGYSLTNSGTEYDLTHKATIGTITPTLAASTPTGSIITGGSLTFSFTATNSAPAGSSALNFTTTAGTNVTGTVAGTTTVAAGSTSGAVIGLSFNGATVGASQSGSFTLTDANATNSPQTGTVSVDVYDHATSNLTTGTLALGNVHFGYTAPVTSNSLTATNGSNTDFRVNLKGSAAPNGNISLNSISAVGPGGNGTIAATLAAGQAVGAISTPFTYTFADDSTLSGASANVGTATLTTTGLVYSGQSVWSTNGNGTWGTLATSFGTNWGANQGSPGLDPGFTNTDTATFDNSVLTAGSNAIVTLDGANPSLKSITFNTATGGSSYTIAQGSFSGFLTLSSNTGTASILDSAGSHTISAPVTLSSNLNVAVTNALDTLTISGNISGGSNTLTMNAGAGTLVLSGGSNAFGNTAVSTGTIQFGAVAGQVSATGTVTVGTVGATASAGSITGNGTIASTAGNSVTINDGGSIRGGTAGTYGTLTLGTGATPTSLTLNSTTGAGSPGVGSTLTTEVLHSGAAGNIANSSLIDLSAHPSSFVNLGGTGTAALGTSTGNHININIVDTNGALVNTESYTIILAKAFQVNGSSSPTPTNFKLNGTQLSTVGDGVTPTSIDSGTFGSVGTSGIANVSVPTNNTFGSSQQWALLIDPTGQYLELSIGTTAAPEAHHILLICVVVLLAGYAIRRRMKAAAVVA